MNSMNITSDIKAGSILLIGTNSGKYFNRVASILKDAINQKGMNCIYVTFNRPYKVLIKMFKKEGVDVSKIFFVDTVTRLSEDVDLEEGCCFVDSPKDLTTISLHIRTVLEMNPSQKKFILIDSVSNLMNFVPINSAINFLQIITNKLRLIEVGGSIMMFVEKGQRPSELKNFRRLVDKQVVMA